MSTLRELVQKSINDLQQFLNEQPDEQDDKAFLEAVTKKWAQPGDVCRAFVRFHQEEAIRVAPDEDSEPTRGLPDEDGEPTGDEEINVLISKTPIK